MREGFSASATTARAVVVGLGLVLLAATACGQQSGYGDLVGVRSVPAAAPQNDVIDPSSLINTLKDQLKQADNTSAITGENNLANGQVPIDNYMTLRQSERLAALQQVGAQIILNRLNAITLARNQVLALPLQASQKYEILYLLGNAASGLNAMQVKIANDTLVDVCRADVKAVAAYRVYGLLLPQVHMLVASFQLQHLVSVYSNDYTNLQGQIAKVVAGGGNPTAAEANVNDLSTQIGLINAYSTTAINVLPGLTAAGFPGNRGQLTSIRSQLVRASLASNQAANDVIQAQANLGI